MSESNQTLRSAFEILDKVQNELEFYSPSFSLNGGLLSLVAKTARVAKRLRGGELKIKCYTSLGLESHHDGESNCYLAQKSEAKKITIGSEIQSLAVLHELGCDVIWIPNLQGNYIVTDHHTSYIYDEVVSSDFRLCPGNVHDASYLQLEPMGYFNQVTGKLVLVQELVREVDDGIDLFVRLEPVPRIASAHEVNTPLPIHATMPVFVHSSWLDHDIDYNDVVEILGLTNSSGKAITGEDAPNLIFFEGLRIALLFNSDQRRKLRLPRLSLRDEVVNLVRSDPTFSVRSRNSPNVKNKDDWIMMAYQEIKKNLAQRGLHMQSSDDSFILRVLHQEEETCSTRSFDDELF